MMQIRHPNTRESTAGIVHSDATPADVDVVKRAIAESIVVTLPIALLVLETDLRVHIASRHFYDTFQVTPENTEGQLVYDLGDGQWDIPQLRALLEEVLPDNETFIGYEVAHTFEGIGHRTMLLNGRRLDDVQLILLTIFDITERKQHEVALQASHNRLEATLDQLQAAQTKLVQQERLAAVGGLAVGIAHDFNNILAIIGLNIELGLLTPNLPPKLHGQLETVTQQTTRAANLVQQILDFGHRGVFQPRRLDLVPFLKELVEFLQPTLPVDIKIDLSVGRDEYIVNADPTQMHQILINLALNAIAAMPEGGELSLNLERLRLGRHDEAPLPAMDPGEWIQISVSDNGTGILSEVLPHLFEPFFTTKAPGQGSGLGLAQVYGLVKQNHGFITVQTQEREGATFNIYLAPLGKRRLRVMRRLRYNMAGGTNRTYTPRGDKECSS